MAELKVRRDLPSGAPPRFWRHGDVVTVQLAEDADPLTERRITREAMRAHGIHRRRLLLPVLLPGPLRAAIRRHPAATAAAAGALAVGMAAGALYGTAQLGDDNHRNRRGRPPAAAGPAPTPGPSTATPPRRHRAGPSRPPGEQDGPARPTTGASPIGDMPDVPSSTTPPRGGSDNPAPPGGRPPTSPPPAGTPPPTTPPPPDRDRCVLHLAALNVVDVRLLCY